MESLSRDQLEQQLGDKTRFLEIKINLFVSANNNIFIISFYLGLHMWKVKTWATFDNKTPSASDKHMSMIVLHMMLYAYAALIHKDTFITAEFILEFTLFSLRVHLLYFSSFGLAGHEQKPVQSPKLWKNFILSKELRRALSAKHRARTSNSYKGFF